LGQTIVKENPIINQTNNQYITSVVFHNISGTGADEYVVVYNNGDDAPNIEGWIITVNNSKNYTLPSYTLFPLESVKIHFGKGITNSTDIYLNQTPDLLNDQHGDIKLSEFNGALLSDARY
jgi:hypothetical protein